MTDQAGLAGPEAEAPAAAGPGRAARTAATTPSAASTSSSLPRSSASVGDGSGGRFPPELSMEAVFRCVRIGPVGEPDAELAYQTAVSIGGQTFKGILRDHGLADDVMMGQLPPSSAEYHQLTGDAGREESSPADSSEAAATVVTSAAVLISINFAYYH